MPGFGCGCRAQVLSAPPCAPRRSAQVLCGNAEYAAQLGAELWPQLAAAYIASQLRPLQPHSDTEVSAAEAVAFFGLPALK